MLLIVNLMICFEFLRIFEEKAQKLANWKSGQNGLLRRGVERRKPTPQCSLTPKHVMLSLQQGRGAKKGTPQVFHDIALLCHSVVVL